LPDDGISKRRNMQQAIKPD